MDYFLKRLRKVQVLYSYLVYTTIVKQKLLVASTINLHSQSFVSTTKKYACINYVNENIKHI